MKREFIFEVCANSVASALAAQEGGAQRVELCDNLHEGGTTPSAGCIALARQCLHIGLHVLIRPRGGDFLYDEMEWKIMKDDIRVCRDLGVGGVVIGALKTDGSVDKKRVQELAAWARPMAVTFHRAFDVCRDPLAALEDIIEAGCDRILTSGQADKAPDGADLLAELVRRAGDRIVILAGGGVHEGNIAPLIEKTHAWEYHGSAQKRIPSAMQYRRPDVSMCSIPQLSDFEIAVTDAERVRRIIAIGRLQWEKENEP
ncbi:MAG: copper homeostasis protein CutC [Candidatus Omnitrophica bacterium]|nr:copper homeostasis protein CutC [Candidatus Omnitrophota bacterium]